MKCNIKNSSKKIMKYKRYLLHRFIIALLAIFTVLFYGAKGNAQTYFNDLEGENTEDIWIGTSTSVTGLGHSAYNFSLTDSLKPYGLGVEMDFPENLKSNNIKLKIEGWTIADTSFPEAIFVINITKNGNLLLWKGLPVGKLILEKEEWFMFHDSINIPADIATNGKLKAFLWNPKGKHKIGIDDLKIEFEKLNSLSYIPNIEMDSIPYTIENSTYLFSNIYYSIYYNDEHQSISVYGKNMDPVINNIRWVLEINDVKQNIIRLLELKNTKKKNGKTILIFKGKNKFINLNLRLICDNFSPKIDFETEQRFTKSTDISRSALVFDVAQQASEIYKFNRHIQTSHIGDEYWLDKEGLKTGKDENSFLIYHCPDVSSLQYNKKKSQIFVNLDWEKDHPFFRFPLMPDSNNYKLEQSQSSYKFWDKTNNKFSAYAGRQNGSIARFMKNPDGFEATYIWTEHADFTDIRTNRATYFGSEEISNADSSIGGFVKYKIPLTKSVFYDNPDSINNTDASHKLINSLESAIKTDTAFSDFLKDIYKKGSEICLHTPEQYTTTRERLEEALEYMHRQFRSPSWIDHGNNNGIQNNREDLICDGTLKNSPWYAMDLWEKYGVKYLHNAYYEEYFTFLNMGFGNSIEKPYSGWRNNFPNPEYWQHKTKTDNLYHWQTPNVLFVDNEGLWNFYFNETIMNDFISNWSVKINHCYPAWVDPRKGFWKFNSDSVIVAQDGFNATLALMAKYRDLGKLNLTTIHNYLDYRIATELVEYKLLVDGRVKMTNNSGNDIKGISFASKASFVLVDRLKPQQKKSGDDIIFWFDLKAGESKIIRLID